MRLHTHPLFEKSFRTLWIPGVDRLANRFLSLGSTCYYVCDQGLDTRIFIYNYFSLLGARPYKARWKLRVYSQDGSQYQERSGVLYNQQSISIDIRPLAEVMKSPMGLCWIHLDPAEFGRIFRRSYYTIFFTEYKTTQGHGYIHSLGYPVPKTYNAHAYFITGYPHDSDPYLLVSNSYNRRFCRESGVQKKGTTIELKNYQGETRQTELTPIAPLAVQSFSLKTIWPDLSAFTAEKPASLRVRGPNVLYSPLLMQRGPGGSVTIEHFQGLNWEAL